MIPLMLVIIGLILGSFVNAFVWRLHKGRDWVKERSECTHCHHTLHSLDLIPVLSWLYLRGKCRYCKKPIEDSPLTEIVVPFLFLLSYLCWPTALQSTGLIAFIFWLVFIVGFTALALYDLRWFLLPNKIVFPLIGLAVLQVIVICSYTKDMSILLDSIGGAVVVAGIFYILFQLSKGTWIGGGDVKLGIVLGLLAGGVIEGFLLLFVASIAGLLASLPLFIQGKANRKTQLPFGPLLIVGTIVVVLFGHGIIHWYTGLIYV